MRHRLALLATLAITACATASSPFVTPVQSLAASADIPVETQLAIAALCSADAVRPRGYLPDLKLAGGMGTGGFKADTDVPLAQQWFDYGLALSHAFYHVDAKAAMKRAAELDPTCARCAWGEAWVLGPTLNYGVKDEERSAPLEAAMRAAKLARPGDDMARRLAEAAIARSQPGETDAAFGQAMAAIARDFPDETEITVLAAHALLIPVRDDDKSGLAEALAMLEAVLRKNPANTGAIHYYIHATEFDDRPEDAIAYADQLGKLAPAASHLVHMPAHTYFHAGRYSDAATVNAKAIEADTDWMAAGGDPRAPMAPNAPLPMYYGHNLGFGLASALMIGDAQLSVQYADHAAKAWPDTAPEVGPNPLPRTYVALALYAPDRMLALPAAKRENIKYKIYRAYGRGEVFLRRGDAASARRELDILRGLKIDVAEKPMAIGVLEGRLALAAGDTQAAIKAFTAAAEVQRADEQFMDPPTWWYPIRRSIAAAYLKAGDFARAETEAKSSLAVWKHDPLALWVLGRSQLAQGRATEGENALTEARALWHGDFDSITLEAI